MNDEDRSWDWHEHEGVVWAAGVAAALLIALLVFAVVRTAAGSSQPAPSMIPPHSSATSTATTKKTESSTSYAVPSVQTSEPGLAPPGPPPLNDPSPQELLPFYETPTTIYNPYATPTPPPLAGHV